jgi:hypothetical protein
MRKASTQAATDSVNEICTIRIELLGTDPLIWREIEVPTSTTLKVLHDIIQIVMDWFDYHLWEFTLAKRRYGITGDDDADMPSSGDAATVRLRDVLKRGKTVIDYVYDFGDYWEHRLTVTNIRQGEPGLAYPRLAGGEWAAPPEDCGGIPGLYETLDALANPDHPEHAEVAEHFEGYDPKLIDTMLVGIALSRIANRRNAAIKRAVTKKASPAGEREKS